MNERIHSCLNGELPLETLSPRERAELQEMQAVIGAVADHLHAYPAPDLVASVMQALPAAGPALPRVAGAAGPWRHALSWLWTPRPVRLSLRPAYLVVGALLLVLSLALASRLTEPQQVRMAVGEGPHLPMPAVPAAGAEQEDAGPPSIYVQFRLEAPDADQVALAGSFTGWRPAYLLEETEPGVWTALIPLHPGVHDYAFLVDGQQWVVDPHAFQVPDSFGGKNSRLSLPVPAEST